MNLKNKIISAISALSMLATMCVATTVSATEVGFSVEVTKVEDKTITISYLATGIDKVASFDTYIELGATIDTTKGVEEAGAVKPDITFVVSGTQSKNFVDNTGISIGVIGGTNETDISADGVLATAKITLADAITAPITVTAKEINISKADGTAYSYYNESGDTLVVPATPAKAYPVIDKAALDALTVTASTLFVDKANTIVVGGADALATALGDRTITVEVVGDNATFNSTTNEITPTTATEVKVVLKVDNNGTVVTSKEFSLGTATVKAEPKAYTVTTTAVTDGETTITITKDAEFAGDQAVYADPYTVVAQFYSEGDVANSWVKIDCTAGFEGSFTVGAQNAKVVSVTAVGTADAVLGQN